MTEEVPTNGAARMLLFVLRFESLEVSKYVEFSHQVHWAGLFSEAPFH